MAMILSLLLILLGIMAMITVYIIVTSLFELGNDPQLLANQLWQNPYSASSLILLPIMALAEFLIFGLILSLLPTPFLVADKGVLAPLASFGYVSHKMIKLSLGLSLCALPLIISLWISKAQMGEGQSFSCLLIIISLWISLLMIIGLLGSLVQQSRD